MLVASQKDEIFTRGKHENLNTYYISQSCFGLPKQSIRNNNDRTILFKQTFRGIKSVYKDSDGYDMDYRESKELCRKAWS